MRKLFYCLICLCTSALGFGQDAGLVGNSKSPYSRLYSVGLADVEWTGGFWKEQFNVEQNKTLPYMWKLYHDEKITHAYQNFEIAAGLMKGKHEGPSFQDGDFYKVFEAMAAVYATTKDEQLNQQMDEAIALIAQAQRDDGYINTPVVIEERWGTIGPEELKKQLGFEKYNMGHLMTAACVHYRATGKQNFLNIAKGVADYLYDFYKKASPDLARNAICPSHYMGVVEMYRATGDPRYLELAEHLVDIKGTTKGGTDNNQDRIPFSEQTTAMGHAVRANYLYAGVADVYSETGEDKLLKNLESIWDDVVHRKMYITGACGALYDGVSPDGTSYDPAEIQQIHQAYGRPYQLPNATAHNETCANIGNVLWNWRMLQITGDAKYADIVELALYNSVLSGISLGGKEFCYNNPLNVSKNLPFTQRWGNKRKGYISLSNCCAPNVTRTLAEVNNYAYSLSDNGLYVNLYGENVLHTKSRSGENISISQKTDYPWNGNIEITLEEIPEQISFFLRIPGWSKNATVRINGKSYNGKIQSGQYLKLEQVKNGDKVEINLPMPIEIMEANPLVEEAKNQVAIKRGPLVYCLESVDLPDSTFIDKAVLDVKAGFKTEEIQIGNRKLVGIDSEVSIDDISWENRLYRPRSEKSSKRYKVRLIPYFAWGNRNADEMTVWLAY